MLKLLFLLGLHQDAPLKQQKRWRDQLKPKYTLLLHQLCRRRLWQQLRYALQQPHNSISQLLWQLSGHTSLLSSLQHSWVRRGDSHPQFNAVICCYKTSTLTLDACNNYKIICSLTSSKIIKNSCCTILCFLLNKFCNIS